MPIAKIPEPQAAFGAGDFWYSVGLTGYPSTRTARPVQTTSNISSLIAVTSEVINADLTQTFTAASGATPQTSPDSKLTVVAPAALLLIYVGHFWYDVDNASTTVAKIFRQVLINGAPLAVSKGMFHEIPPSKGFEAVTRDEVFFAQVKEFALLPAGTYEVEHQVWVDNAASLTGNVQIKFMDRAWLGYAN